MKEREFAGVHNHTMFSFNDGVCTPEELVLAAKNKGLKSIAVTEHGHAHSHADFFLAAKKHGVKGMLGVEAYVIHDLQEWHGLRDRIKLERKEAGDSEDPDVDLERSLKDKESRRLLGRKGHLVMLACNRAGLANIYRVIHRAHKHGFYKKPRADKAMLAECAEGVIASSACMGGVVSNKLWQLQRGEATWEDVVAEAVDMDRIFGRGRFFLEIQANEHEGQKFINDGIVKVSRQTGIPLIATTDAHYTGDDDWKAQEILHMLLTHRGMAGGVTMATRPPTYDFKTRSLFVKSGDEMYESFLRWNPEIPQDVLDEAFANTLLVDSLVEVFEPDMTPRLPSLPYPDTFKELGERSIVGLKARNFHEDERYVERLFYELGMVKDKGIANYFLVVNQIVDEARKKQLIGPGRGSAAGSLICYLLGITNIDPIEHNLMFERFINVDRTETPDIDLDFEDVDGVKEILRGLYGEDNVACISTFGTSQIKGIMKDVGRVFDIDHTEVNTANARIEKELHAMYEQGEAKSAVIIKLEDVYRLSPTFKAFVGRHPEVEEPIKKLYGKVHHVGRHASGVVIGDDLPAETAVFTSKGILQTSFTDGVVNKQLSAMGLVKFDILGLATLSIIHETCRLIADRTGRHVNDVLKEIDPKTMDFNDMHVMRTVFWQGNMTGIFQLTSRGIQKMVQMIRPDCFGDVAACGALYRPGPLGSGMDKLYASNKAKFKSGDLTYDHPILEEILKETYGCFVYQEHILEMGRKLGDLSWKDTNRLRKLFLKRTKDAASGRAAETVELKQKLTDGFVSHGLSVEYAEKTWEELEAWASYGFNAAHAKAYGMVTMQTAYLRTYHPLEFFAAVLTKGQAGDLQEYVNGITRQGIKILPVDVNASGLQHSIEGDAIRLALTSAKGVGVSAALKIRAGQPYIGVLDFMLRSGANKGACHALMAVGAFESVEPETSVAKNLLRHTLFFGNPKLRQKKARAELDAQYALVRDEPDDPVVLMEMEREFLGFNLRGSAFTIKDRERKIDVLLSEGIVSDVKDVLDDDEIAVACMPLAVKDIRERPQKNGTMFAFLKLVDRHGQEIEAPCFGNIWQHVSANVRKGDVYLFTMHRREDEPTNFIVGRPGWKHSRSDAASYVLPLDGLPI